MFTATNYSVQYSRDVSLFKHTGQESDEELAALVRQGDDQARNDLVCRYLPLVFYCVRRLPNFNHAVADDLVQEGNQALMDAAKCFDPSMNVQFTGYAIPAIWRRMAQQGLHRQLTVKVVPKSRVSPWNFETVRDQTPSIDKPIPKKKDDGKSPETVALKARDASLSPEKLLLAKEVRQDIVAELEKFRNEVSRRLTYKQARVFRAYYGIDSGYELLTLRQVGQMFGLTWQCVQQNIVRAWDRLSRRYSEAWLLDRYKRLQLLEELIVN